MKKITAIFFLTTFLTSLFSQTVQINEYQISQKYILLQLFDNRIKLTEIINIDTSIWELPEQFDFIERIPGNINDLSIFNSDSFTYSDNKLVAKINSNKNGITNFTYTYYIKNLSSHLSFSSNFQVQKLDIFIPVEMGIELSDPLLTPNGNYKFGDGIYLHYKAEQVPKGTIINPNILPMSDNLMSQYFRLLRKSPKFHSAGHIRLWNQTPFQKINPHYFVLFFIIIFAVAVYLIIRKNVLHSRNIQQEPKDNDIIFRALVAKKQKLLNQIMKVELKNNNKLIDEDSYHVSRDRLKSQLININLKLDQFINRNQDGPDDTI